MLGATKIDGHDGYYGDDTTRSNRIGLSVLGGYGGNQGPGRGYKTWLTGGGASHAGEGGQGDRGPGGLSYGSGALDFLLGGSGGGGGNGGESGGGGGAMEIVASGDVTIAAGVTIKMNGGTIFVNPNQGAYRTGGAGSGGGIRIEASNIRNLGILEALGGDAAGQDERETGQRYRQSVGGGGGGGRVAIISDGTIVKGSINVNGGKGMAEGLPGLPGSVYVGSKSQVAGDLIFNSGTLTIDTGGSWSHSSGTKGAGVVTHHSFQDNGGARFGYGICTFSFDSVNLGSGVAVVVRGRNAIQLKVAGNVLINTAISLDGSSGSQGAYSGRAGPGGWNSGRAADNVISNEHIALEGQGPGGGHGFETGRSNGGGSYGGQGTGGLFGGTPGSIYGDDVITYLVGGSGGGHAERGTGNSGGGGGAMGIQSDGNVSIGSNGLLSVNGGNGLYAGNRSGAGGSGGSIRLEAANISNSGTLSAKGGDALIMSSGGAGGAGRIALLTPGNLTQGTLDVTGGEIVRQTIPGVLRSEDLVGHWQFEESSGINTAADSSVNGLDGTITGSPARVPGMIGNAFRFDGNDDRVVIPNNAALHLDKYTVSFWVYPERNNEGFTGLFGRQGRNYAFWLGNSNNNLNGYIHHRFQEGTNDNSGVGNVNVSGWNKWFHVVGTNQGLRGLAATYLDGMLIQQKTITAALGINTTAPLNIGVAPDNVNSNNGYFLGIIDEVRLYGQALPPEEVYYLYQGDMGLAERAPLTSARQAGSGTATIVQMPSVSNPSFTTATYGQPFSTSTSAGYGVSYEFTGLPPGLDTHEPYTPASIPGSLAWYASDNNTSIELETFTTNLNVTTRPENLVGFWKFDETTGTNAANSGISGIMRDATLNGGAVFSTAEAKFGAGSLQIPTSTTTPYAAVQNGGLPLNASYTISAWFKNIYTNGTWRTLTRGSTTDHQVIIGAGNDNLGLFANGRGDFRDSGFDMPSANYQGAWHHIAAVGDADQTKFYLDGIQQGTSDRAGVDNVFAIGNYQGGGQRFAEFLDDVRVYNIALNDADVTDLYGGGNGDDGNTTVVKIERIKTWKDLSGNGRHAATQDLPNGPVVVPNLLDGKPLVRFNTGDSLSITDPRPMPMTVYIVGRQFSDTGANRELFTQNGWRMADSGTWRLRRWNNNNPDINTAHPSGVYSLVGWRFKRYDYSIRVNGVSFSSGTSTSGQWHQNILFDRINFNSAWELGEVLMFQDKMEDQDRLDLEGYLAHKWGLEQNLPGSHPFKSEAPLGLQGDTITGIPTKAGDFQVTVKGSNVWGTDEKTFTISVSPATPLALTLGATDIGSTGARLNGILHDSGGEPVNASFDWGLSDSTLDNNVTFSENMDSGAFSHFLPNLDSNTTYYYRAKASNEAGTSNGNDVSAIPWFHWKLDDQGTTAFDPQGLRHGQIVGATSSIDATLGRVLHFDGDNDYVTLGDVEKMDTPEKFTISLWFKRESDISGANPIASNNGVNNVLIAQSSSNDNDNLEIGTEGSQVEIYIDSGTGATTDTRVSVEAGIQSGQWHHLSLTYGSEMTLYVDGTKITTWTQFIGRLDSSETSPLSLGIARPGDAQNVGNWGDFNGTMSNVRIYPAELSALEVGVLAGNSGVQSFKTGILPAPPVVEVLPVTNITDSNATLNFELISYDGNAPELTVYWGPVERGEDEGLWKNKAELGQRGTGQHFHKVGGYSSGDTVYYRIKATSSSASDWSDKAETFRLVSKPTTVALPATDRTESTAILHGRVQSNGGEEVTINLDPPGVAEGLIAHWRFDEGASSEAHDSTGYSPTAQVFGGATWTAGMGGAYGNALDFDGSSQAYVQAGSMRISGATSFTAWVYKRNLGNWQRVIDFGNGPDNNNLLVANEGTTSRGI